MANQKPVLFRPESGHSIPELERRLFSDADGNWAGWAACIRTHAGEISDWHIHPASETFVFVKSGRIRIEFGIDGAEHFEATAGDFFFIPANAIHRELTDNESNLDAFVLRIGEEPEQTNVDGPIRNTS